jgi:V/A-type H+-transporting ATPase subunit D
MSRKGISGVRPTRIELLKLKKQELIAEKGHDLLQEKLDAMLIEYTKFVDSCREQRKELDAVMTDAVMTMKTAAAILGSNRIEEIALSSSGMGDVSMGTRVIMGVRVPEIGVPAEPGFHRGYSYLGTTSKLDESGVLFGKAAAAALKLAELEGTVGRLALEIQTTRRRVNALEHILLPRIRETRRYIEMRLEEREREDLFRRKRTKQVIQEHEKRESAEESYA